jgi:hypothetical protein
MNLAETIEKLVTAMDKVKTPAEKLPPILLKCVSQTRPGLSAYRTTSDIIMKNQLAGIPTDDNPDGSTNLINIYTYNVVKSIFDALKNDASIQTSLPMESLLIQVTGGNAGGAMTSVGTNILDAALPGILR